MLRIAAVVFDLGRKGKQRMRQAMEASCRAAGYLLDLQRRTDNASIFEDRMRPGVLVGQHERMGAHHIMTPDGLQRGVGLHRLPELSRFDLDFLRQCRGAMAGSSCEPHVGYTVHG